MGKGAEMKSTCVFCSSSCPQGCKLRFTIIYNYKKYIHTYADDGYFYFH